MKILIFTAYYEPEKVSSLELSIQLYEYLAKNHHHIQIVTPMPSRGLDSYEIKKLNLNKIEKKYNGRLVIYRVPLFKERKNIVFRTVRYLLMHLVFIAFSFKLDADLIFVQSTPPTMGLMAAIVKKIKKCKMIYNLQDIFPDSLISAGITHKGSFIWKIGQLIENSTYKNADYIITISNAMKKNIENKGVKKEKIKVIYNWNNFNQIGYVPKDCNELFDTFHLDKNNFYVVYAGNLGYSQDIMTVLKAAKKMNNFEKIKFLIFGNGALKEKYIFYKQKNKLSNVLFFELLPQNMARKVYSLGDICLITCKKGVGDSGMPSKVWNIMSCGRAIVSLFDLESDISKIITENKLGLCVEPGKIDMFEKSILYLYDNQSILNEMSEHSLYAIKYKYNKKNSLDKYLNVFNNII